MEDHRVLKISREIVKPSTSQIQNDHPQKLKLSYLDQLVSNVYVPIIFFYQANEFTTTTFNHVQISRKLKHSLSQTLDTFYPLAGRMNDNDNAIVECNDAGIEFIEARAHTRLEHALKSLDDDVENKYSKQYVPIDVEESLGLIEKPFLLLQITFFDCGGIALGICFSHAFTDVHSIMMFINAWASISRSDHKIPQTQVSFDLANHFPTQELQDMTRMGASDTQSNKTYITKMLLFDKDKLALLKKEAISTSTIKDPTGVEVISAFIWKFMIDKSKAKTVFALHAVNLRGRKRRHLLKNVYGNCFMATCANMAGAIEFAALVSELRRSVRKIDDDYITKAQSGDNYMKDAYRIMCDVHSCNGVEMDGCYFSSWCGFPFYQVDFGFGTPVLFYPSVTTNGGVVLVSSKSGDDIQAWVKMEPHILEMLENQINIISSDY